MSFSASQPISRPKTVTGTTRPLTSISTMRRSKGFFTHEPAPVRLSGPLIRYRERDRLEKRESYTFYNEMKQKWTQKNMNSPYKKDFVKLKATAERTTRSNLERRDRDFARDRMKAIYDYKSSCEQEIQSEKRHCQTDHFSRLHKDLRILSI